MRARTVVVDGSYFARSSFEAGDLRRGCASRLLRLREDYEPRVLVVAWDSGRSERCAWCETYKAARRAAKAEWPERERYSAELADLQAMLPALGIAQARADGWEGDDVLATIARTWPGPTVVCTPDHDMLQLVGPGVAVDTGKGDPITAETIVERTGLTPAQHLAAASLEGCKGDGVDGVGGIGAGRAAWIVRACPDVVELLEAGRGDEVYAQVVAVYAGMAKWVQRVIGAPEVVALTRRLVSLYTVELEVTPAAPDPAAAGFWLEMIGLGDGARRSA